ncbi:MAG: bifunctional diaminohydroxyphosphoribosylaminopyrimidine deaminase/5-amino-6-(5-phosphoribosylamino)uracil reductase RibD [Candidatus Sulfobium sp.]
MNDRIFTKRTLALAARARGKTSPNPMVGALLVKSGRIISEGYHKRAGTPHAEAVAIDAAGDRARGATLYVSLEPCCHEDKRTPPCTQKIISSGIRKVVTAMEDPNPKVSGRGIAELRKAGITVVSGILREEAEKLNEYYIKHITTGTPFVVLKVAMTLDGKIATPEGESKWITGDKARRLVHRLRGEVDGILTAIGTVKADNPRLTCRTGRGKSPLRIVIDPELQIAPDSCVLESPPDTIVVTKRPGGHPTAKDAKKYRLREKNVQIVEYEGEKVDLPLLMKQLGRKGIISVLVEGGSSLNSYCLESGIVDKLMFFIAPKIIGGRASFTAVGGTAFRRLSEAHMIRDMKTRRVGDDILIEGYLNRKGHSA